MPARDEAHQLASLRGLPIAGINAAFADGLLSFGEHRQARAWFIRDESAGCARRLDGKPWRTAEGPAKALDTPGTSGARVVGWPIGILRAKTAQTVIVCEGGPDFIAAYAVRAELRGAFGIVCLLGSALTIHASALAHFSGKCVRFVTHTDDDGLKFAERNAAMLADIAGQVSIVKLDGLLSAKDEPVSDLCDTLASRQPWGVPAEIAELFTFTGTSARVRIIPAQTKLFPSSARVAEIVTEEHRANGEDRCGQTRTDAGDGEREGREIQGLHKKARALACHAQKQSRAKRWALAGEVRGFEARIGRADISIRVAVFETWFALSEPYLDAAKSRAEHRAEFLADIRRRRVATGQTDTLAQAIERARESAKPDIPHASDAPPSWRLLAAVCRELQTAAGNAAFFITKRAAMKIIGGKYPMDGQRALEALENHGVVRCVKPGDAHRGGKASRYRYLLPMSRATQQTPRSGARWRIRGALRYALHPPSLDLPSFRPTPGALILSDKFRGRTRFCRLV
jgi:hypothetical protein